MLLVYKVTWQLGILAVKFFHTCRHLSAPDRGRECLCWGVLLPLGCRGSTWLPTAAGGLPDSSGPSWAAAKPRDRDHTGAYPPCLHRAPGAPGCPGCPTRICTGSRSRIRISSGDPPPLTDSAGWNRSTGSGTASSAAGGSAGSWEESSTCPVREIDRLSAMNKKCWSKHRSACGRKETGVKV